MLRRPTGSPQGNSTRPVDSRASIATLEESDLGAIHGSLAASRLRTAAMAAIALPLLDLVGGIDVPWIGVALIAAATVALNPVYAHLQRRGVDTRRLIYAELGVSTFAITMGLRSMGPAGLLFSYVYLVVIVPATMVSGTCGATIGVLSSLCVGELLLATPLDAVRASGPPVLLAVLVTIFALVAHQCFFYKRYLRDKNQDLAASSDRLSEANAALAVTAETALGLLEVGRALGTSLDLGVLIDRLHAVVVERLRTDWCVTLLVDPASPSGYRVVASHGLGTADGALVGPAFAAFAARAAAGAMLEVPDTNGAGTQAALERWGVASGLFTAMRCRNQTLGLFATGYRARTGAFTPLQRELATGIATQAAMAIENATLHAQQREESDVSAALLQVSEFLNANLDAEDRLDRLTALAADLVHVDFLNLLLCDPEQRVFRIVAGAHPCHPDLLEEARELECTVDDFPIFRAACRDGWAEVDAWMPLAPMNASWMRRWALRSLVILPLRLRGGVIGAIVAGSHHAPGPVAARTRRLLNGIAQQTAISLENSRLVENLRAANSLKSEFIGTMSHELRTPLNAIIGYNELLAEGEFGPVSPAQHEACEKVLGASRQLLELIQATLDVSRIEAGALPVTLTTTNVNGLLAEIVAQVPASWVKRDVELRLDAARRLPMIETDQPKLKMVIRNLVHNALKFTERGTVTVRATAAADGDGLEITVSDTGVGISPEDQAIIFEMFRQVDGSDRRRHDGVGLGLYIVDRLVTLLGGAITVESELGRGSCFRFRLPLHPAVSPRSASPAPAEARA